MNTVFRRHGCIKTFSVMARDLIFCLKQCNGYLYEIQSKAPFHVSVCPTKTDATITLLRNEPFLSSPLTLLLFLGAFWAG